MNPGTDVYDVEEHFVVSLKLTENIDYYWERGAHANQEIPNETRIYGSQGGIKHGYCSCDLPTIMFYDLDDDGKEEPIISMEVAKKQMNIILKCYEVADNSLL